MIIDQLLMQRIVQVAGSIGEPVEFVASIVLFLNNQVGLMMRMNSELPFHEIVQHF